MEFAPSHIFTRVITLTIDFQQNKKALNHLQHIIPSLLNMHVVQDLICGRGIGYQKSLQIKKRELFF
jgi:hypothetical protein